MHPAALDSSTCVTFQALVDAIVPTTPALAVFGAEQAVGAVHLTVHEYMMWELDHSLTLVLGYYPEVVPLAAPTAALLNAGAVQLVCSGQAKYAGPMSEPFAALSPEDRIRTLALLENLQVDLGTLPPPYRNDGGMVRFVVDFLNRQTMFGNYSEWPAYGTTRLATPTARKLECFPVGWRQVGYPGVSNGYRAFLGNMLTIVREGGESCIV